MIRRLGMVLLPLALACSGTRSADAPDPAPAPRGAANKLERMLARPELQPYLRRDKELRLQIALGWIERREHRRPTLVQLTYRTGDEYFYPASTVKLFAAVAALERLKELRAAGHPVDLDTPLRFHPLFEGEKLEDQDPTNLESGKITVRHEIRKLFLVSDNEAFNRLYELVGQDRLMASLERTGLGDARLIHRLAEPRSAEQNRRMPRIDLLGDGFTWTLDERESSPLPSAPAVPGLHVGQAYLQGESRVEGPMDFAAKNYISLVDLQRGLCKVLEPDADCGSGGGKDFSLTPEDRALLRDVMGQFPRESANPRYDPAEYPDTATKFLLAGLSRHLPAENLRIYNKYGQAYGFSTENAYVVDERSGKGLYLAATIYTNADGVLNDDRYEYQEIARPFFGELGAALGEVLAPR